MKQRFKIQPVIDEDGVYYIALRKRLIFWQPMGCKLYEEFGVGELYAFRTPQQAAKQIRSKFGSEAKIEANVIGNFAWSIEQ